jgi:undecaprenyl-diphosphatase
VTLFQTFIFAIVQGITELFPISSVAHGVLTPYIFRWNLSQDFLNQHFLSYLVMLHIGTALALLIFFRREWLEIIRSLFTKSQKRLLLLVIVGSIPAGLIGLALEKSLTHLFGNVTSAAFFLIVNGLLLYYGERIRSRGWKTIDNLTYRQALVVGLFQALALVPGFSRSGASMTAGFWAGLKHEEAARFSMILATPIIAAAGLLEVPKLAKSGVHGLLQMSLIGGLLAGVFAYISVTILIRWFKKNEISAMKPFAYYCWIVGGLVLLSRLLFG